VVRDRRVRRQLTVLVVIGVIATAYVGATYARLDKLFGIGT
jgi:hypothetical protein